jgi:hypothetical protein
MGIVVQFPAGDISGVGLVAEKMLLHDCEHGCNGYRCNTAPSRDGKAVRRRAFAGEARGSATGLVKAV